MTNKSMVMTRVGVAWTIRWMVLQSAQEVPSSYCRIGRNTNSERHNRYLGLIASDLDELPHGRK